MLNLTHPRRYMAEPRPIRIPFTSYDQRERENVIVASIEYHYDEEARLYRPHSVFTATQATPEERRKHVGGWARQFYFTTFDFDWCPHDEIMRYHESGGGSSPYVSAYCSARKFERKHPEDSTARLVGQPAIWWNPEVCDLNSANWGRDDRRSRLPLESLQDMGLRVLHRPACLSRDRNIDPFMPTAFYDVTNEECEMCREGCE